MKNLKKDHEKLTAKMDFWEGIEKIESLGIDDVADMLTEVYGSFDEETKKAYDKADTSGRAVYFLKEFFKLGFIYAFSGGENEGL